VARAVALQIVTMSDTEHDYLLGTHDAELVRLGFQHRVWAGPTADAWERGGFRPGATILDVGCGPGYATLDLAQLVGRSGRVIAVDRSERFIGHLEAERRHLGLTQIETRLEDLESLSQAEASVDYAFARWVLCFVPRPDELVARVARSLRPGGTFVVMDYCNYEGFCVAPRSEVIERGIAAVAESFRRAGGNADVGRDLPEYMLRAGLEVQSIRPVVRLARPRSLVWEWPWVFFVNFLPTLVEAGLMTENDRLEFNRDWEARSRDPGAYLLTPPMVEIVGVKPGRG